MKAQAGTDSVSPSSSISTVIYSPSAGSESIELGRLLGLLIDYKWLIILTVIVFGILGAAYANLLTPIYRSNVLIQVERRDSVNPIGESAMMMNTGDSGRVAAEIEILRSRMVLGKVVDKLGLDTRVIPRKLPMIGGYIQRHGIQRPDLTALPVIGGFLADHAGGLMNYLGHGAAVWGGESLSVQHFGVVDGLRGVPLTLRAGTDGTYHLYRDGVLLGTGRMGEDSAFLGRDISLNVSDITAPAGAEFTLEKVSRVDAINSLATRFAVSEQGGSNRLVSTGMLRLTLTGSDPDEIRRSLDAISQAFLIQNVERQSAEAQQSLAFLMQQAPELRDKLATAENRMSEYRAQVDSINLDSEAQSVVDQFAGVEQKLNDLKIREAELAHRYTAQHPAYQTLLQQKRYLTSERDRLNEQISAMPAAQQEVIRLQRDVQVAQAIYVNVLNKMQELRLTKAGTIGNVRIIDAAVVEDTPVKPRKTMIMAAAALLGALLACGYVLVRAFLSRGIESPEQLEDIGVPVYATVPLSPEQPRLARTVRHEQRHESADRRGILAQACPTDSAIEALRSLRTSLHFAMLEADNNCLMICGPSPGIGKSFVTLNLGAVCAQAGQRVLVMDADLRKGNLHRAMGQHSRGGLSEVLSDRLSLDDAIRASGIEGLDYLSRGMAPPNPSELLVNGRFTRLIDEVSRRYDLVIIDTPPVLAVTEAAIVGKRVGTTLMVARFQLNPLREVRLAMRRLETAGIEVKGCVINGMQRKASVAYGYGYYNYQYAGEDGTYAD